MLWILFLGWPAAQAARITVDSSGAGDYSTLAAALTAAGPGDYIAIEPGTYSTGSTTSGWSGAIVGLGASPEDTVLSGGTPLWVSSGDSLRLDNLQLSGSTTALRNEGTLEATRVFLHATGSYALYNNGQGELRAFRSVGGWIYGASGTLELSHYSAVDSRVYLSSGVSGSLEHVVSWDSPVYSCSRTTPLSYALYDSASTAMPSCVVTTSVYAGFDLDWTAFSDDGDPSNDDLTPLSTSLAIDGGDPGCKDVDGSVCDLGFTGGPLGSDTDSDSDGLPDSWEVRKGTSTASADGDADPDGDGLDNLGEWLFGCDPQSADSDGDGVEDLSELQSGADPLDPTDQGPTAALLGPSEVRVGQTLGVDASGSSDPSGDALSYRFYLASAPAGTALTDADLSASGASAELVPDLPGTWTIGVEVSDASSSDSVELEIRVLAEGSTLRVPDDVATLDEALPLLESGMTLELGAGDYALSGQDLVGLQGLRIVGAGREQTNLELTTYLPAADLQLQDLYIDASTQVYGAVLTNSTSSLELYRVDLVAGSYGIYASAGAVVSVLDSSIRADSRAVFANNLQLLAIGQSRVGGAGVGLYVQTSPTVLQGVLLDASQGIYSSDVFRGSHLTFIEETSSSLYGVGVRADHVYLGGTSPMSCRSDGLLEHVIVRGVGQDPVGCDPLFLQYEAAGLGSGGVPEPTSLAWDGGSWAQTDADGSRADVGWTGGPLGQAVRLELDPWEDRDGDTLSALTERILGSDDGALDSDGDGLGDHGEVLSGLDPADPSDGMPRFAPRPVRLDGSAVSLELSAEDPQGEKCSLSWDDGEEGFRRELPASGEPVEVLGYTLRCGEGSLRGEQLVIREQSLRVPEDQPTLEAALAIAEDHHRILLGEGTWALEEGDLRGRHVAIQGLGGAEIQGELLLDGPAALLTDLAISGDVQVQGGSLQRLEIDGSLRSQSAWLRNLQVSGDVDGLERASAANLSVGGRLHGAFSDLRSSVALEDIAHAPWTLDSYLLAEADAAEVFVLPGALWIPWPGSLLWDSGSVNFPDLDGSQEDVGWTGGPEASALDGDTDGMPDAWETWYGISSASEDNDGDTLSNLEEFTLGTDPTLWDSDGDRLPDASDPDPRQAQGDGLSLRLTVDDAFPRLGQQVLLSVAGSQDPGGLIQGVSWEVLAPSSFDPRSDWVEQGQQAWLTVREGGTWLVRATLNTQDGESLTQELLIHPQGDVVTVPLSSNLQRAVDEALPGQVLELQSGPREISGLVVDKDLVIRHEEGADGALNSDLLAPILTVSGGARVRVEGITLRGGTELPVLKVTDGATLELRAASVIGGDVNVLVNGAELDARNTLFSLPSVGVVEGLAESRLTLVNCNLGWTQDEDSAQGLVLLANSRTVIQSSILEWQGGSWKTCLEEPCGLVIDHSLIALGSVDRSLDVDWSRSEVGEPGFLRAPDQDLNPGAADMRLGPGDARDAGPDGMLDPDGSPLDLGIYGGDFADWLDVDNDRDGFTNLEGDCDDWNPELAPDLLSGECRAPRGCSSTGNSGVLWVALGGLLVALSRSWRWGEAARRRID
ncbi:MAG: hypothetical protein VX899_10775 [Myxococcota bacterium]|nr:hypothetical protein [Myxococcota bacterium]